MSDLPEESLEPISRKKTSSKGFYEVRYSLAEMMEEVQDERADSDKTRELVDAAEIGKMFVKRKRKKK